MTSLTVDASLRLSSLLLCFDEDDETFFIIADSCCNNLDPRLDDEVPRPMEAVFPDRFMEDESCFKDHRLVFDPSSSQL